MPITNINPLIFFKNIMAVYSESSKLNTLYYS